MIGRRARAAGIKVLPTARPEFSDRIGMPARYGYRMHDTLAA
jgi:hypothetical protein